MQTAKHSVLPTRASVTEFTEAFPSAIFILKEP
jgi:hypothetical protein